MQTGESNDLMSVLGHDLRSPLTAIRGAATLLLQAQGELDGARACLEHALTTSERTLGPDHPDTATAIDNMGTLLQAEGDLPAARRHIERALAVRERSLGVDNPATGASYNNLGMLIRQQGDTEGASTHAHTRTNASMRRFLRQFLRPPFVVTAQSGKRFQPIINRFVLANC